MTSKFRPSYRLRNKAFSGVLGRLGLLNVATTYASELSRPAALLQTLLISLWIISRDA